LIPSPTPTTPGLLDSPCGRENTPDRVTPAVGQQVSTLYSIYGLSVGPEGPHSGRH